MNIILFNGNSATACAIRDPLVDDGCRSGGMRQLKRVDIVSTDQRRNGGG